MDAMICCMVRSRLFLPKLESPPSTILDYMSSHFPHIPRAAWQDRMERGLVTTSTGVQVKESSPYAHGLTVFYAREVLSEPSTVEAESILFRDDEILIADKPHGMPVTPAGEHVSRSLLVRLQEQTGLDALVPLHRLDRDTAGLVLFGIKVDSRRKYHQLFADGAMEREYEAVARVGDCPEETSWLVENRLTAGDPWFRRRISDGEPVNAVTAINLIDTRDGLGLFHLRPRTGKKHQLRVHMAAIGFPILGDNLYPEIHQPPQEVPLQLLASRLSFADPLTGTPREFKSERRLLHGWQPAS